MSKVAKHDGPDALVVRWGVLSWLGSFIYLLKETAGRTGLNKRTDTDRNVYCKLFVFCRRPMGRLCESETRNKKRTIERQSERFATTNSRRRHRLMERQQAGVKGEKKSARTVRSCAQAYSPPSQMRMN